MATFEVSEPVCITARLLPGLRVGASTISIKPSLSRSEGRSCYRYYIDTPKFRYTRADVYSGVGGGSIQEGLSAILSFLIASAESLKCGDMSDNADLFPKQVAEWAYMNSDELSMLSVKLEEQPLIREESR